MSDERISLTLDRSQLHAIDRAMDAIESHLERLLAAGEDYDEDDDGPPQRPTQRPFESAQETRLGARQESFCRETLMRVLQNPQLDASEIADAAEVLRALDQLRPRLVRLQRLGERASNAHSELSRHVVVSAVLGYSMLEAAGRHHGLEGLREQMWARRSRRTR